MGLRNIDIVVMYIRNWPAAVRWYTKVLGLRVGSYEEAHQFCMLRTPQGETKLALTSDHPEFALRLERTAALQASWSKTWTPSLPTCGQRVSALTRSSTGQGKATAWLGFGILREIA